MSKPSNHTPNPGDGFEVSDIKVKLVVYAGIATVLTVLGSIGVSFMFTTFLASDNREYMSDDEYVRVKANEKDWTDSIRLQSTPVAEMEEYIARSASALNSYGLVDDATSTYRIPVDEAITLVVEQGALPKLKAPGSAQ